MQPDRPAVLGGTIPQNSGGLRFDSQDDALSFARDGVESGNDWLARNEINFAKHYIEGRFNLVLNFRASTGDQIGNLVFRRIPMVNSDLYWPSNLFAEFKFGSDSRRADRDDYAMRVGVSHPVECAEQLVPSRVWFEARKQRPYFDWITSKSATVKFSCDASVVVGEGEPGVARISTDEGNRVSVDCMVESVSEVTGGILDDTTDVGRELFSQADFVGLLAGLRIFIDNCGVWFSREKGFDARFSIFNVFPAALDLELGTLEMVDGYIHGGRL